ncbi:Arylamine N-acetyltransferase, pineal gland isozyme NAT-10 [Fusarium oxysporum f. sp. rapae]|uniref:Arylamine N-acetyltransferase, pineal gland isozyme NAT-10 n=1 Tax=Fusarium oxysporum f. sp. rapae TaxID=485398 RepID=A0A8J5P1Z3_FUSOX|nr:Arylamine N-acetyltransferase, pineal gland isozyme NAT-10 [Fusarium oxysporum f. sp. rapae]
MADRIRYSKSQLEKYYDRIAFPASDRQYDISNLSSEDQRSYLNTLTKQQILTVPFENLTLHYSWHRIVDVNADHLYDKIVSEKRGGYCMENNTLFNTVLLSLGYHTYMVGARVFNPDVGRFGGSSHCLSLVIIDGKTYAVDVGFGARNPTEPLEVEHERVHKGSNSVQMRLRHDIIAQNVSNQKLWIYEYRSRDGGEWVPQWCFMDYEVLPEDIRVFNMSPSKNPSSFFTFKVVSVQFTSEKEDYSDGSARDLKNVGGAIDGIFIIDGNVFRYRKGGETKWERNFKTEDERLDALRKYFGVELTKENERAIRGTAGAIP